MMKFKIFLLIICLLAIPLVISAANETVMGISENFTIAANNTNTTKLLPEEFYGTVVYSDGTPVAIGSEIITMDQRGKVIGNFTMIFNGSYGDSYTSASRLIVSADNADDMITFYIGNEKSSTPSRKFDSGSIKRADITMPIGAKPTPTPEPTVEVTTIVPTPTVKVTTIVPTPTVEVTTIVPTPTPIQTPKPTINDTTIKFLGVLLVGIGICVVGAIITYYILTKKMKRDDEEEIIL